MPNCKNILLQHKFRQLDNCEAIKQFIAKIGGVESCAQFIFSENSSHSR